MNLKKQSGVTLLILVLTIVIMLIIVGSALNMIFDANGLLRSSKETQDMQKNYSNQQEQTTSELLNQVDTEMQPEYRDPSGANSPKLGTGMIPVKWVETNWVVTDMKDSEWYNYQDKKWANVMLTDGLKVEGITDANTATLKEMKGKKVTTVGSMFVWIPRYSYQIASNYHMKSATGGVINIKFLKGTTNTATLDGKKTWDNQSGLNKWNVHPAFEYGEATSGIWVAKFEASHTGCTTDVTTGQNNTNVTTLQLQVKPGITSWRNITISNMYTVCLNYNSVFNSHMMKNDEWGAVAYLAQSSYGKNNEVTINSNSSYYTGGASGTTYTSNIAQSTTGNVYGIYDMSGGAWEYTAGYVNNSNARNYGASLVDGAVKTKNVYSVGSSDSQANNYTAVTNRYGDALYETSSDGGSSSATSSWYDDYSVFSYGELPVLAYGGTCDRGSASGLFAFAHDSGSNNSYISFRPVLVVL